MDYVKINNKVWDVLVTGVVENFTILYSENTGRVMDDKATMKLDPIGTFIGHKVTFERKNGYENVFDDLYNFFMMPRYDGVPVEIVHNQNVIRYNAYVSQGQRGLKRIDENTGKVYWDKLEVNIVPIEAYYIP